MTSRMKPEIKAAWLAALRSGEFKQGRGYLHRINPDGRGDTFCCLGVLCVLAEGAGVLKKGPAVGGGWYMYAASDESPARGDRSTTMPPYAIGPWAMQDGESLNWVIQKPGRGRLGIMGLSGLPDLNDDDRWSFEQIADIIEEQL